MPMANGQYTAPTWNDGGTPAINASELQAMSDALAEKKESQLYEMISGSDYIAGGDIASGDLIGVVDVSAGTGKKTTLSALAPILFALAGATKLETGSYAGSGGESKTLSFSFQPKVVICYMEETHVVEQFYISYLCIRPYTMAAWNRQTISWGTNSVTIQSEEADMQYRDYYYAAIG